jgi:rubredoxin
LHRAQYGEVRGGSHEGRGSFIEDFPTVREGAADDYVEFRVAGDQAEGTFTCSACGYGVAVSRELPSCPMCGGTTWEESGSSPFTRSGESWL